MSSALIKLTTPLFDSVKYDRLTNLLFAHDHSTAGKSALSVSDINFDMQLEATFDTNKIVTDINLKAD